MKPNYLPVEDVAILNDIDINSLKSLYSKTNVYGNDERFKKIDGKLYVLENYKYPFADELNDLRQKALILAKNENNLCKELAKLGSYKKSTLQKYFYRFTFKQIKTAKEVMELLKTYINQNSLIPLEDLNYDY
jgi:DNA uptake protein ComE-like DNA-binding protein